MKNYFLILYIILFGLILNLSCSDNKRPYSKVEVYCACMSTYPANDGFVVMSQCLTPARTAPSRFIKPDVLYYSSEDTLVVNSLSKLFFESEKRTDTIQNGTDARFVILLRRNAQNADTLVFQDQTVFVLNEKYRFIYDINIIDSVRGIIGKKEIKCD